MCIKSDFKEIILKLATYGQRKGLSVVIKVLSPMDCLPLPGAIYIRWNMKKMYIKSDFKAIFLNLQQMGKVIRAFCWHQKFVPKRLSVHAPGLYTYIKSFKMCLKSHFFLNLQQMGKVIRAFCWHQKFVPKWLCEARWLSGRVSDSGARGPGFETYRRRVVSLSKTLYSPKVLVNYPGSDGSVPTWLKNCWLGH